MVVVQPRSKAKNTGNNARLFLMGEEGIAKVYINIRKQSQVPECRRLARPSERQPDTKRAALAGRGDDLHLPIEQFGAADHIGDPNPFPVTAHVEAYAIIRDCQHDIPAANAARNRLPRIKMSSAGNLMTLVS